MCGRAACDRSAIRRSQSPLLSQPGSSMTVAESPGFRGLAALSDSTQVPVHRGPVAPCCFRVEFLHLTGSLSCFVAVNKPEVKMIDTKPQSLAALAGPSPEKMRNRALSPAQEPGQQAQASKTMRAACPRWLISSPLATPLLGNAASRDLPARGHCSRSQSGILASSRGL